MNRERTQPINVGGDKPVEFSCDWDGEVWVIALPYNNVNYPSNRILLNITGPGGRAVAKDADGHAVPSYGALTLDQVDEVITRLDAARVIVLNAAGKNIIEQHAGLALVRSDLDRWGLCELGVKGRPVVWHQTEESARALFLLETHRGKCEGCGNVFGLDVLRGAGEDGPLHCPPCLEADIADYKASTAAHVDPSRLDPCPWTGTMGEGVLTDGDERPSCPRCGADIEPAFGIAPALELPEVAAPAPAADEGADRG